MNTTMNRKTQQGFTLIEVLVAFVIMTMGLLGVASLQMTGMQSLQGSVYRFQAVRLAEELADRMRTNIAGLHEGDYITTDVKSSADSLDCSANPCEPAQRDLWEWYSELETMLQIAADESDAKASITCSDGTCAEDAAVTIRIDWRERADQEERDADYAKTVANDDLTVVKSFALNTII